MVIRPKTDTRARYDLRGSLELDGSPDRIFPLFTPEGERSWIAGWSPQYAAANRDVASPGTAFSTDNHGARATWVIVECDDTSHRGRYVMVIPDTRAALVSVDLARAPGGRTRVDIAYTVTSLSPDHDPAVRDFAAGFEDMLTGWSQLLEVRDG